MKNTIALFIALFVTLFASPSLAIPFHDCHTDPANLGQGVHEEHGAECGNTTEEGVPTNSDCTAGCTGTCPLGEWLADMNCFEFGGFVACEAEGNIVCGMAKIPRTYAIACEGPGEYPAIEAGRNSVSCEGIGGTVTCDCTTSSVDWAANCQ